MTDLQFEIRAAEVELALQMRWDDCSLNSMEAWQGYLLGQARLVAMVWRQVGVQRYAAQVRSPMGAGWVAPVQVLVAVSPAAAKAATIKLLVQAGWV